MSLLNLISTKVECKLAQIMSVMSVISTHLISTKVECKHDYEKTDYAIKENLISTKVECKYIYVVR